MSPLELKELIVRSLSDSAAGLADTISVLKRTYSAEPEFYSALLEVLCDVRVANDEAERILNAAAAHRATMERSFGRGVDFRVALLDYLTVIEHLLSAPTVIELRTYLSKLQLATIDELTGLYNRRFLNEYLRRELHRASRYGIPFSIIFLDLDDFKAINDTHGHQVGDQVLVDFAELLKRYLRSEDIASRYGGEEFMLVMPQTDTHGAMRFSDRLVGELEELNEDSDIPLSFSGGIATFPTHATTADQLIDIADRALYEAKIAGKGRIRVPESDKRSHYRFPASLEVLLSDNGNPQSVGFTHDVSRTGLCFETDHELTVGQTVSLLIRSRQDSTTYRVRTQIVWLRKEEESRRFRLGARYSGAEVTNLTGLFSEIRQSNRGS